jgi:hypothetical protein
MKFILVFLIFCIGLEKLTSAQKKTVKILIKKKHSKKYFYLMNIY